MGGADERLGWQGQMPMPPQDTTSQWREKGLRQMQQMPMPEKTVAGGVAGGVAGANGAPPTMQQQQMQAVKVLVGYLGVSHDNSGVEGTRQLHPCAPTRDLTTFCKTRTNGLCTKTRTASHSR